MLLATDLAAVDHHEGTVTLIANAINWDASDERVDEAYDDAVARLDRMTAELAAPGARDRRGLPPGRAPVHPPPHPGRAPRGRRGGQGADPRRRGVPDRGVAAVRDRVHGRPARHLPGAARDEPQPVHVPAAAARRRPATASTSSAPARRRWSPSATGKVTTHPIAGTRWRGATEEEDELLEKDLLADEKERAEHVMLVDLGRNDLGRVCEPGSVKVHNFFSVERYSHVMHLVSTVTGTLRADRNAFDAVVACFPAGTLSGAPKLRAMEIIEELEPTRRGLYGGIVGYLDFAGDADTAIAIRTALVRDGVAYVQAGGGIVADSDPEAEDTETLNKARAVLSAVATAATLRTPGSDDGTDAAGLAAAAGYGRATAATRRRTARGDGHPRGPRIGGPAPATRPSVPTSGRSGPVCCWCAWPSPELPLPWRVPPVSPGSPAASTRSGAAPSPSRPTAPISCPRCRPSRCSPWPPSPRRSRSPGRPVACWGWCWRRRARYVGVLVVRLLLSPPPPADLAALPGAPRGRDRGRRLRRAAPRPGAGRARRRPAARGRRRAGRRGPPPAPARRPLRRPARRTSRRDPDRAAWDALDAGRDPTADPRPPPARPVRRRRVRIDACLACPGTSEPTSMQARPTRGGGPPDESERQERPRLDRRRCPRRPRRARGRGRLRRDQAPVRRRPAAARRDGRAARPGHRGDRRGEAAQPVEGRPRRRSRIRPSSPWPTPRAAPG